MTIEPTRRLLSARKWSPPRASSGQGRSDRTGPLRIDRRLTTGGEAPEDVVFDSDGWVVTGLADGSIVRIDPASGRRNMVANTGGRPLGLQPCADGSILVCDHDRGLLRVQQDGSVDVLVDTIEGEPLRFASNVTQGRDGTIWFTSSSTRWDLPHYVGDILEHSCTGRIMRRDPDGTVTVLLRDLKFGNGLVLAPDGSHLLFAETAGYRISRYWLAGERAGTVERFAENLPGMPDNMSLGSDGLLWVGMPTPRNALLDRLLPRHGLLRTMIWNLPDAIRPNAEEIAWVIAFDLSGRVAVDLRSTGLGYGFITAAAEHEGVIVACGLSESDVIVIEKP